MAPSILAGNKTTHGKTITFIIKNNTRLDYGTQRLSCNLPVSEVGCNGNKENGKEDRVRNFPRTEGLKNIK